MFGDWQETGRPQRTALVLVDLQNSFLHPDGGNYYPAADAIVPNLHRLLDHARSAGRLIVHVADRHRPGLHDFESHKLPAHCVDGDLYGFAQLLEVELAFRIGITERACWAAG